MLLLSSEYQLQRIRGVLVHDNALYKSTGKSSESVQCAVLKACDACTDWHMPVIAHCTDSEDFPIDVLLLTSVSHLGWPSRAAYLGGLGLIRTSP